MRSMIFCSSFSRFNFSLSREFKEHNNTLRNLQKKHDFANCKPHHLFRCHCHSHGLSNRLMLNYVSRLHTYHISCRRHLICVEAMSLAGVCVVFFTDMDAELPS
ncbi:hypothetical protein P691DRAFT_320221 [Macrolepiota fuliginosa MF-IS2]|uniref:Uncharacterized protein n=1 Tax=Macrolepiota fuliginosa MF-IS2 TaxID=1400762 RepID=A0A9P5XL95_9AGAR|nr:hypothetical protein P691DRAFT_320221 [Macrolepiota fuliginosa MF-IS2]